jgi:hypothetical protein
LPGFRHRCPIDAHRAIQAIRAVLDEFSANVVFAELNIARNTLWISVRPVRGIRVAIAAALREKVGEAKLVSSL